MREKLANSDLVIARIAVRQHGVVSQVQLLSAGISTSSISRRVNAGRLYRVHRGVYAVGRLGLTPKGAWMAAVLACRTSAAGGAQSRGVALSHRSAAALWGMLPPPGGPVDVSVVGTGGKAKRRGIRIHRCQTLLPACVTSRKGIPVTTSARTISDLRRAALARSQPGAISQKELRRAIRQAELLGLPLGSDVISDRTRSELERLFLRLCTRHRFPVPEVNVRVGDLEVDFLWRDKHLVVETDGYRYHRGKVAFENDRNRDLRLRALGYDVVRITHHQVTEEPQRVAAVLAAALRT